MAKGSLVTDEIDQGWRLVQAYAERVAPVTVAFWMWDSDDFRPRLYIATSNYEAGYGDIVNLLHEPGGPQVDSMAVKLIRDTDRRALDVLAHLGPDGRAAAPHFDRGARIGDGVADQLYVYPTVRPSPTPA